MGRYVINKDGKRELVFRTEKKKPAPEQGRNKPRRLRAVESTNKSTPAPETKPESTTKGEQS